MIIIDSTNFPWNSTDIGTFIMATCNVFINVFVVVCTVMSG